MIIVGSGQSALGFIPPRGLKTIAVNGAIDWLCDPDYFFTLDPTKENINRIRSRRHDVQYHAAVPDSVKLPDYVTRYIRVARRDYPEPQIKTPSWWAWRLSAVYGLNKNPMCINTGNSAYGALNLAYHLGAKKVMIIGVDCDNCERIEGGYSGNLSHVPQLFASALSQIEIVSCGKLNTVPQMGKVQAIKWLRS